MGGGARAPEPEGVAGSSSSSRSDLQGWPISALRRLCGRQGDVRAAPDGFPAIRSTLPPALQDKVEIVCYYRGVCAHDIVSGKMAKGTPKHHDGNGVYVAFSAAPPVVYLTCTTGGAGHRIKSTVGEDGAEYCRVINKKSPVAEDGTVVPLGSVENNHVHWVMLSKEELDAMVEATGDVYSIVWLVTVALAVPVLLVWLVMVSVVVY